MIKLIKLFCFILTSLFLVLDFWYQKSCNWYQKLVPENWYQILVPVSGQYVMGIRWSSYVAPKPRKGGSKTQNGQFLSKIALRLNKVCYKVSLCENCQRQSCTTFIGLTIHAKIIGVGWPLLYLKFWVKLQRWSEIANFRSIFARNASAVTSSEKVQLTLIGSPLRAF